MLYAVSTTKRSSRQHQMKSFAKRTLAISALLPIALLSACGGGGSLPDAVAAPVVVKAALPSQTVDSGKTFIVSGTATSRPNALASMSWTVTSMDAGQAAITIANGDCGEGARNTRSTNGITQSDWACDAFLTAPKVSTDANYRVTFTSKDDKGNSASDSRDVRVVASGSTIAGPTASTPATLAATAGDDVGISCYASGGTSKDGKYTTLWSIKSNPGGLALTLDQSSSTLKFKAPSVKTPTPFTVECRVTDDNLMTSVSDTVVTVNPTTSPAAVANAGATQTVAGGTVVSLDGSASSATGSPQIYYQWTQIDGPAVALSSDSAVKPSFVAPQVSDTTRLTFRLIASTKFPIDPAIAAQSEVATVSVYVSPAPSLMLSISAASVVTPNTAVRLSVSVSPVTTSTLYYAWSQVSGPSVTLTGANTSSASFVSPNVTGSAVDAVFTVQVSRKPIAESLPSEIVSSDVIVRTKP